ncbi:helix-turn-helix domain-containing protein [Leptospira langatensis]|uniref:Helix-turn-helix domain-containing protein n=1 Tax=Leptospira langatensis TaxID=2484983 RepID=A0A5F1ZU35_9LEPT|nr:helix-turn-helix domain-containing protein [Leptospira langatensis]TGJ98952.1 helix-turn-helix domain-containing protein [Leptospira langatensis]TGL40479.1 helix-turn-helix domain-containing protein [Leptospira langatensis]
MTRTRAKDPNSNSCYYKKILILFFLSSLAFPIDLLAKAPEVVEIFAKSSVENLSPKIEYRYLGSRFQHCKPETLKSLDEMEWHHNSGDVVRVPRSPLGNWLRFRIVNLSKEPIVRTLSLYWLNVPEAELCSIDTQGRFEAFYSNNETTTLLGSRSLLPHFTIQLPPQQERTYYLFIKTNENINYPISLLSEEDYTTQIQVRSVVFSAISFALLLSLIANIYFYFRTKKLLFVALLAHLLSVGVTLYFLHGREFSSIVKYDNSIFRHSYFLFLGITHFSFFLYLASWSSEESSTIHKSPIFWISSLLGLFYPLIVSFDFWYEHRIWILIANYGFMIYFFGKSHASLFVMKAYDELCYVGVWTIFLLFSVFKTTFQFEFYPYNWLSVYGIIFYFPLLAIVTSLLAREITNRWAIERNSLKRSHLASLDVRACVETLLRLLKREKIYLKKSLKEEDVAKEMGITVHQLSEIINTEFKTSFPSLLNQYRVEEAKFLLIENPNESTARIGENAGFSSRSAFYLEFKKVTGSNPNSFRKASSIRS